MELAGSPGRARQCESESEGEGARRVQFGGRGGEKRTDLEERVGEDVRDARCGFVAASCLDDEADAARVGALVVRGDLDAVGVGDRELGRRGCVRARARGDGGAGGAGTKGSGTQGRHGCESGLAGRGSLGGGKPEHAVRSSGGGGLPAAGQHASLSPPLHSLSRQFLRRGV